MTKLKTVSAVLAAVLMAALGSATVFAWNGSIEASSKCKDQKVYVYVTAHDGSDHAFREAGSGTLIFKQGSTSFSADWTFDSNGKDDQVIAKLDFTGKATGKWKVYLDEDHSVKAEFEVKPCASASPTESASPTTSTSPTSGVSPTTGTSPTSAAASPTTLPSPPVTGAGPGDGGFSAALIALGLVILVGGGLTLFLSRGSSSTTT